MSKDKIVSKLIAYPLVIALVFFVLAILVAMATPEENGFYGRWGAYVAYILAEIAIIKLIIFNFIIEKLNIRNKNYVLGILSFLVFILYLIFFVAIIGLGERNVWGGPY